MLRKVLTASSDGLARLFDIETGELTTLVMGALYPSNVSRLDNATVRIALPAYPTYEILLPEFIRLRIDRTLVRSNATLLIPVAFTVMPTAGSATLGGPALYNMSEAELAVNRTVNLQLFVTLHADTWQPGIGGDLELTGPTTMTDRPE